MKPMRIFVAGASGAIGRQLVPLLVKAGHDVAGMTRSPEKTQVIKAMGAEAVVCDVFDAESLTAAVTDFNPDIVIHQLTDLPRRVAAVPFKLFGLNRIRKTGTDNLLAAAKAANVDRVVAQSIAFKVPGFAQRAVDYLEMAVLAAGGVVLRYGQFYGEGTWFAQRPKKGPTVNVKDAAKQTVEYLDAKSGVYVVAN